MFDHVEEKLKEIMQDGSYFSSARENSADVRQLLIYIGIVDRNFNMKEELMKSAS